MGSPHKGAGAAGRSDTPQAGVGARAPQGWGWEGRRGIPQGVTACGGMDSRSPGGGSGRGGGGRDRDREPGSGTSPPPAP